MTRSILRLPTTSLYTAYMAYAAPTAPRRRMPVGHKPCSSTPPCSVFNVGSVDRSTECTVYNVPGTVYSVHSGVHHCLCFHTPSAETFRTLSGLGHFCVQTSHLQWSQIIPGVPYYSPDSHTARIRGAPFPGSPRSVRLSASGGSDTSLGPRPRSDEHPPGEHSVCQTGDTRGGLIDLFL